MNRTLHASAAVALLAILMASPALSGDWINAGGGAYETSTNWSPAVVPVFPDSAIFDIDAGYTVSFGAFPPSPSVVRVDQGNVRFEPQGASTLFLVVARRDIGVGANAATLTIGANLEYGGNSRVNIGPMGTLVLEEGCKVAGTPGGPTAFFVQPGGRVEGTGDFSGRRLSNSGTVAPSGGFPPFLGSMTFGAGGAQGGYDQTASGVLEIDIVETEGFENDRIDAGTNTVTLGGTLNVTLSGGRPRPGQVFDIVTGASVTGVFASVTLPPGMEIVYTPAAVQIRAVGYVDATAPPLDDAGDGQGVAWGDFDNDGDLDIYLTRRSGQANKMFRNDAGVFVDATSGPLADPSSSLGVTCGDYDNDGDLDIYVSNNDAANKLLRNDGGFVFVDVTAGPEGDTGDGHGASWVDFDNDGDLDLYLCVFSGPNKLLRNDAGAFVDVTSGPLGGAAGTRNAVWADYDNDGDMDVYVVRAGNNQLLRNEGGGIFTDATTGPLGDGGSGTGADWGDVDNDGDLDLYFANTGGQTCHLLRNNGGGSFTDVTNADLSNIDSGFGDGVSFGDFDNDGELDLYLTNFGSSNKLLYGLAGTFFLDVTSGPEGDTGFAEGGPFGDFDGDGDLDLYVANSFTPNKLLRNDGMTNNHWLSIDLVGVTSNRSAIGARVRAVAGGVTRIREVSAASGQYSMPSLTVEFGLGDAATIDLLEIRWPSGTVQSFPNVAADQRLVIPESFAAPAVSWVTPTVSRHDDAFQLDIFGSELWPFPVLGVELRGPSEATIAAYDIDAAGAPIRLRALFDLSSASLGAWNLRVQTGGGVVVFPKAVVVYEDGVTLSRATTTGGNSAPALSHAGPSLGKLAFVSDRDGVTGIYVKDPAAPDNVPLVPIADETGGMPEDPAFSRDGTKVVFAQNGRIRSVNWDGGDLTDLTTGIIDAQPAWSPAADVIVYSGFAGDAIALFTVPAGGGAVTQLTFPPAAGVVDRNPCWSPDGRSIAFVRAATPKATGGDIFKIDASGAESTLRQLTLGGGANDHPSWSPDGRWIAFDSNRLGPEGRFEVFVMDSRGDNFGLMRITEDDAGSTEPAWDATSTALAVTGHRSGDVFVATDLPAGVDTDGDLVPDRIDACIAEGVQLGRLDRDFDGCLDAASSFRTVRYWNADQFPVVYETDAAGDPRIGDGSDFTAIDQGFAAWTSIAGIGLAAFTTGLHDGPPNAAAGDGRNTITFSDPDGFIPGFLGFAAITTVAADTVIGGRWYRPGEVVDADILFNAAHFSFSTPSVPGGTGAFDLQSVATHEIGHVFGLAHSSVPTSTMYFSLQRGTAFRSLEADDTALARRTYATTGASLSGRILRSDGVTPIPGAAVLAIGESTGDSLMTVSGVDGTYAFFDVAEDFRVYVQPLDGGPEVGGLVPAAVNPATASVAQADFLAEFWDGLAETNADPGAPGFVVVTAAQPVAGADILVNEDITPPGVLSVSPADAATDAPSTTAIAVKFDDRIDLASVTAATFRLENALTSLGVAGNAGLLQRDSLLVFTPTNALEHATPYTLRVGPGIRDRFGNTMSSAFVSAFTTQAAPPLVLTSLSPSEFPAGARLVIHGSGFDPDPNGNNVDFFVTVNKAAGGAHRTADFSVVPDAATPEKLFVTFPAGEFAELVQVRANAQTSNLLPLRVLEPRPVPVGNALSSVALGADVRQVAVSPGGAFAYVATEAGVAAVRANPADPQFLSATPIPVAGGCVDVVALPDGARTLAVGPMSPRLRAIDTNPASGTFHTEIGAADLTDVPLGLAVVPGGVEVLVVYADRVVLHRAAAGAGFGAELRQWSAPGVGFRGDVAVAAGGQEAYASTTEGRIAVLGLQPDEGLVSLFLAGTQPRGIGALPAGGGFVAVDGIGTVRRGAGRGPVLETAAAGGGMSGIAVSPEGGFAYAANFTLNRVDVIDLQGGRLAVATQFATGVDPRDIVTGQAGRYVYVVTGAQDRLEVYDTASAAVIASLSPQSGGPGTIITVNGSGFGALPGENIVRFGDQGGIVPIESTPTKLVFVQPAAAGASIRVEVDGRSTNAHPYRVADRPDPGQYAALVDLATSTAAVPDLVMSPTGRLLFAVHASGDLGVVQMDAARPDFQRTVQVLNAAATGLSAPGPAALTPDGRKLYIADIELSRIQAFAVDESSPAPVQLLGTVRSEVGLATNGLAAAPDGRRIHGTDSSNDFVFGIDTAIDSVVSLNNSISGTMRDVALHPGGKTALVGVNNLSNTAAILRVLDIDPASPTNGQVTASIPFDIANNFGQVVVRPDGRRAYASVYSTAVFPAQQFVSEVDTDPASPTYGTVLQSVPLGTGGQPARLRVNHGGTLLFVRDPNTGANQAFVLKPVFQPTPISGPPTAATSHEAAISLDDARLYVPDVGEPASRIRAVSLTPANAIAFQSGTTQVAVVGQTLPAPFVARVTGAAASLLEGTPVVFAATSGSFAGDATGHAVVDANGLVRAKYTAGGSAVPDAVTVSIAGASANASIQVVGDPTASPPQILSVQPGPNESPGRTTLVGVDFSKPIDPATVNAASFRVRVLPAGPDVAGVYTFAERNRRAVFTPSQPLDPSTPYEVTVTGAVADANANALSNPGTFPFATAGLPPVTLVAVEPPASRAGDLVVLSGSGFGEAPADNQVSFAGVAAQILAAGPAALTAIVPAGAQSGDVVVIAGAQTSNPVLFTVLVPAPPVTQVRTNVSVPTSGQHIAIVADGSRAYMTSPGAGSVVPILIAQEAAEPPIAVGAYPFGVAAGPGGKQVYVSNFFSNDVSVIDSDPQSPTFHEVITTIPVGTNPAGIAANPNGLKLYVVNYGDSTLTIVDTDPASATRYFAQAEASTGRTSQSVAVSPDGLRVFIGTTTGLLIVDAIDGAAQAEASTGKTSQSVALSPDGAYAVVLATDGTLFLIDVRPGSPTENRAQAEASTGRTSQSVAVSPDGAFVYVTNTDGTVQAFQIVQLAGSGAREDSDGEVAGVALVPVATIEVGENPTGLAFDPSGSGLLLVVNSGSNDISFIGTSVDPPPPAILEADLRILPRTIGRFWWSWFVFAWLEFTPDRDARHVDAGSVRLNDAVSPITLPPIIYDLDHDGIDERMFLFWRPAVLSVLPAGDAVPVEITGAIDGEAFVSHDTVRVIGPRVVAPVENDVITGGAPATIRWQPGDDGPADHVGIELSYDNGASWTTVTTNQPDTGEYAWVVPAVSAETCKVQITIYGPDQQVFEVGVSPAFTIRNPTNVQADLPLQFALRGARPNPFVGATALFFDLPAARPVTLRVYSVDGRVVRDLVHRASFQAGRHVLHWDGRDEAGLRAGSGVYFAEIQAGSWRARQKVVRVR